MYFYLPIALTSISLPLIVGLGLLVGLLSGLFGVGGGFLLTPLLIMFGIPPTVAAASDSLQIVGASTSGTFAHWKLGNVDFKMGVCLLIGGFAGGLGGVQLIKMLRMMGNADFIIKITYVLMLGIVGGYMFFESLNALKKSKASAAVKQADSSGQKSRRESGFVAFIRKLPMQTRFEKSGVTHSAILVVAMGALVGILAAIMGVGGGFLMVPVMIYLLRMPMHVVVGTSLFQILFTCIEVSFLQAYTNHTVDFILAVMLLVGSTFGTQIGSIIGRKLHGDQLKILLAVIVLAVTAKIMLDLLIEPSLLLSLKGGH
ncbi:MAG: sulfite exporter TauE/SafE family protein [Nitrospirota bacterium]